jgi:transcriptional regulator with XRE-family HTH domain
LPGVRAAELGEFLRSRRARVDPVSVGFPAAERRRTPGLRREELASVAGVTVSWLAKLEQGRARSVSAGVLDALARGLRLDTAERAHLFTLAGLVAGAEPPPPPRVTPALRTLLVALEPHPAYVLDRAWNIVAWNAAELALFPDLARSSPDGLAVPDGAAPNLLELTFTDPDLAELMTDHDAELHRLVAQFRLHWTEWRGDPGLDELVERLLATSPRFAELWGARDVAPFETTRRQFDHPVAGHLEFDHHRLAVLDQAGAQLVVYTPVEGSDSSRRLRRATSRR